ncbi:hypothetical protein [Halomarina pelagica]|uniref:hypothetical protein n=1 Tax=Halomarina pelagica TaxID=2961599 RepID=UPI0020C1F671|nr:hypothetical protein [Halomarina sp. BND7]
MSTRFPLYRSTVVITVAAVVLVSSAAVVATPQNNSTDVGGVNESDDLHERNESNGTDSDNDGLSDHEERVHGTDPTDPDTDSDGVSDGEEVERGTNPMSRDTDADGVEDLNDEAPTNPKVPNESPKSNATAGPASGDSGTLTAIADAPREYVIVGGILVAALIGLVLSRQGSGQ